VDKDSAKREVEEVASRTQDYYMKKTKKVDAFVYSEKCSFVDYMRDNVKLVVQEL
jgi:hypothetical protein